MQLEKLSPEELRKLIVLYTRPKGIYTAWKVYNAIRRAGKIKGSTPDDVARQLEKLCQTDHFKKVEPTLRGKPRKWVRQEYDAQASLTPAEYTHAGFSARAYEQE